MTTSGVGQTPTTPRIPRICHTHNKEGLLTKDMISQPLPTDPRAPHRPRQGKAGGTLALFSPRVVPPTVVTLEGPPKIPVVLMKAGLPPLCNTRNLLGGPSEDLTGAPTPVTNKDGEMRAPVPPGPGIIPWTA